MQAQYGLQMCTAGPAKCFKVFRVRCQHLKNQEISYFKDPDFQIFFLEKLEDLASLGWTLKHQKLAEVEYGLSLL